MRTILIAFCALVFSNASFAKALVCPEKISTAQSLGTNDEDVPIPLTEWEPFVDNVNSSNHWFESISVYDGHPKELALLKPKVAITKAKNSARKVQSWDFSKGREVWMVCGYGRTKVTLAAKMGNQWTKCSVDLATERTRRTLNCK